MFKVLNLALTLATLLTVFSQNVFATVEQDNKRRLCCANDLPCCNPKQYKEVSLMSEEEKQDARKELHLRFMQLDYEAQCEILDKALLEDSSGEVSKGEE